MDEIFDRLMHVGFSKYESQVYVALLRHSPMTGYELSKQSGVPRSMVYQTITKLLSQRAIQEIRTEPLTYIPVPPKELLGRLKKEADQTFAFLEEKLHTLEQPPQAQVICHIEERKAVMEAMNAVISRAEQEVWFSIWNDEMDEVQEAAEKALNSGVRLYSLLFTSEPTASFGRAFYHHPSTATVEEQRMGQRLTVIVRDDQEVIIAGFVQGVTPVALHTEDSMLVLLAKEYIRHDMMMKVLTEAWGEEGMKKLWKDDPDLFYIVSGQPFNQTT
ncbi:TrmB family transcriptional regulator [Aneurinibacillus sp. BA2021]|nr:TrmB family transcriptional regulator [Aneurinibacillus sp. BA2021]